MARLRDLLPPPILAAICGLGLALPLMKTQEALPIVAPQTAVSSSDVTPARPARVTFLTTPRNQYKNRLALAQKRPLFSETRRLPEALKEAQSVQLAPAPETTEIEPPKPAPRQEPAPPLLIKPDLSYRGHMKLGQASRGLVFLSQSRQERWVEIGDIIDGWTVAKVSENAIVLQLSSESHIVELKR